MTELNIVKKYRAFAQKFIPESQLRSLAEFSWRVQNDSPAVELILRYPQTPRQLLEVLWWDETMGGYIETLFNSLMLGEPGRILVDYGFLPQANHSPAIVKEILYTTILKALMIGSLDIELEQERTTEQQDGINLLSLM